MGVGRGWIMCVYKRKLKVCIEKNAIMTSTIILQASVVYVE